VFHLLIQIKLSLLFLLALWSALKRGKSKKSSLFFFSIAFGCFTLSLAPLSSKVKSISLRGETISKLHLSF
jgi:hypothetical protein